VGILAEEKEVSRADVHDPRSGGEKGRSFHPGEKDGQGWIKFDASIEEKHRRQRLLVWAGKKKRKRFIRNVFYGERKKHTNVCGGSVIFPMRQKEWTRRS